MPRIDSHWKALALAGFFSCIPTSLALAQSVALTVQAPDETEADRVGNGSEQAGRSVRIFVGPQYVSGPAISQPARAEVAGRALVASFSSQQTFRPRALGSGQMPMGVPVTGRLTSGFGPRYHPIHGGERYHAGIDVAAPSGSPIRATSDGVISGAGWTGGYGLLVRVDHGAGIETRYAHMSRINVALGQQVNRGEIIGFVGSTGDSTGPHVHYEVRQNGLAINPLGR